MGTDWSAHKKNRNLAIAGKRADSKNEPIFFALRGIGATAPVRRAPIEPSCPHSGIASANRHARADRCDAAGEVDGNPFTSSN